MKPATSFILLFLSSACTASNSQCKVSSNSPGECVHTTTTKGYVAVQTSVCFDDRPCKGNGHGCDFVSPNLKAICY
ncbi:predicted protein [Plenodomus lingam JN3]|uniref:Predicted protein n=1 Tax=Leptosphaeria maculans (strain JN3 / isolate v23.1.3 / race Av1-4-5-6-7-8) TaxID=985895 RepID=E5ABB7_LEPMJ|nr:predicted protein [Plenodomus lingam JN3]CBY00958.1 predicted protein [Plenodomus lingam JN3]